MAPGWPIGTGIAFSATKQIIYSTPFLRQAIGLVVIIEQMVI